MSVENDRIKGKKPLRRRVARGTESTTPGGDGVWREPLWKKLARRCVTIPAMVVVTVVYLAVLPFLLAYGVVADALRGRPMLLPRFYLTMAGVLIWRWVGLLSLFAFWIAGLGFLGLKPKRWIEWNVALEGWWGTRVIGISEFLYGMSMDIKGDDVLREGPVVVFSRHTSVIDTMLPLRILEYRNQKVARIVKKRELIFDPCIDSVSQRLPRAFVRRGSSDPEAEIELVRHLADGMTARDGLWIFPEGTRFSPRKREKIIHRLREKGQEDAAKRAEELRYTLPPKPGGALALLDRCQGMDVVFCAHTGMEGANRLENLLNGSLFRRQVKVEFWRVPAGDVPAADDARVEWLHQWWLRLDSWVEDHQDADLTELLARE